MKKVLFCASAVLTGLLSGCVDKNEVVDAETKPSWLGGSIYQELKTPDQSKLTGTFNNFLRLVDDLGEAETLDRTGSKTVFPANDEAFGRFFQHNAWGVASYEQLTTAQKKLLLYNAMLDNALLLGMMSNISNTSQRDDPKVDEDVKAMKHQTNVNVIDTVTFLTNTTGMPQNNRYWDKYREKGIHIVSDASRPMLLHLTREHMLKNNITTSGDQSDFAMLTGTPYEQGNAYIFDIGIKRNEAVTGKFNSDVICLNGYVHQMEDVIVPPGNMANVLRSSSDTRYFSRMLDYYAVPVYDSKVTNDYNSWALTNGKETIDSIFTLAYLNTGGQSGNHSLMRDPDGKQISGRSILTFDPGWNQYSPLQSTAAVDLALSDAGVIFAPTDKAVEDFFLEGGDGAYLIDLYGVPGKPNIAANLVENLDSLKNKRPDIIVDFIRLMMKPSFTAAVPSKFADLKDNDSQELVGLNASMLSQKAEGKYDILFANNGVVYKLNVMLSPDKYQSVMAPSTVYPDMQVMNWLVTEPDGSNKLGVDFSYYLMSMNANYAFFVPDDEAFEGYYVDVTSLGTSRPQVLHLFVGSVKGQPATLHCDSYAYDKTTGEVGERIGETPISTAKSLLIDILNMHTVVLEPGETLGTNKYYKTKHGGEICVSGGTVGSTVSSGQQIDNGVEPATIKALYTEKNGTAYRISHAIESPRNSVYSVLNNHADRFSEFLECCSGFDAKDVLQWAGISSTPNDFGTTEQDAFLVFTANNKNAYPQGAADTEKTQPNCPDMNVKMFNTYNYTLFAPNNAAMEKAYAAGLPQWSDIQKLYEKYLDNPDADEAEEAADKAKAYQMICQLKDFTRYHFMSTSVYADNVVRGGIFKSLCSDDLGMAIEMRVAGGNGRLEVTDAAGKTHSVDAGNGTRLTNLMARDYWFTGARSAASSIYTSSFCVIHEIDEVLSTTTND